ncbi:hypothetical protein JAAARDRAFT_133386 [Jaapia argillacea MUCL 33604]|uniref:DUF6699 domain-containing protein n=1 Tax=Jaapia argillacea MUCL 33604 TaxID=933084 RepID=A0A067PLH7_9AGAM|nr:hypothetical protein JAAARDRAFT_133386 [Jaapia argillacea MUCL 33604]
MERGTNQLPIPQVHSLHFPSLQTIHLTIFGSLSANAPRSRKYPSLNPILASDTTLIRYDIRKEPSSSILASTFTQYRNERAISNPTNHLRLVCKDFPWVIEIKLPTGGLLTCEHVWQAIYNALQVDIVDSEWGILVVCGGNNQEDRRKGMLKAAKKRGDNSGGPVKMKRIDWLGDKTMFKGLDRDDGFAEKMIMPGTDRCDETWVIKLGDR